MINIMKLIAKGNVCLCKLNNNDTTFLLLISTADKTIGIPMIKDGKAALAYISASETSDMYENLSTIIEKLYDKKIYPRVYKFRPVWKNAPEHSKTVTEVVKPVGDGVAAIVPTDISERLKTLGYDYKEAKIEMSYADRDYSDLLKDPINKQIYEFDDQKLKEEGITYDSLSLEAKSVYEDILHGKANGIIFQGPAGTGKSTMARILANKAKAPLLNLQITEGTTAEDLVGMFIPNDEEKGGKWKFVEGVLLRAYYKGYPVLLEEVNYGQPGVTTKLNEYTDKTPRVFVNGKMYTKHPNFVVYMTMNPGYEDTKLLNVALKNRFKKVEVPALSKKDFTSRAQKYSMSLGYQLKAEFFDKLYDFANFIEKEGNSSKWHGNVTFSIRNAQGLCDNILARKKTLEEFEAAVAVSYLNDLGTDNDNSEKLELYKNSPEIKEEIRKLYELYDFAEKETVEITESFDDIFGFAEEGASAETSGDDDFDSAAAMDELLDSLA